MQLQYHSLLSRANAAFRSKDYESAVALYEDALISAVVPIRACISFNLDLARKRASMHAASTAGTLEKPSIIDDWQFNLIIQSGLFEPDWYLAQYKDTYRITGNPLAHYLARGVELGTNPSPRFDTTYYIKINPDVIQSSLHPLLHYVSHGKREGRSCLPPPPDYEAKYTVSEVEYTPRLGPDAPPIQKAVRTIAFYLPQFHAIPENDAWWGKGFTEWTNVKPATPQFKGHYQPHVPDDFLGYYDLLDGLTQTKQVELAKQYGVEGFCFYLYWFTGHRLLEQPVDNYLNNPSLDLPFCICWANENWSRRWDGKDQDLLIEQHYSPDDDLAFIAGVAKYLRDPRYIRIHSKPLLLVYRPNQFPDIRATTERWRGWCRENSIGEIYLIYPQSFECVDPALYGFDAACEFPPNNSAPPNITQMVTPEVDDFQTVVYDWRIFVDRSEVFQHPGYSLFKSISPSWDNTPRKRNKGTVLQNSCPKLFTHCLTNIFMETRLHNKNPDERIVFINAWNEWAEGAHLEPDKRYGYAWLAAVRTAHSKAIEFENRKIAIVIHAYYFDVFSDILERIKCIYMPGLKLFITTHQTIKNQVVDAVRDLQLPYCIEVHDNRGRDVLPFIKISKRVLAEDFDIIVKVHTKKSLHRDDGAEWREKIYSQILSERFIKMAISAMSFDNSIGIVSPTNQVVPMSHYWGSNADNVLKLAKRIGIEDNTVQSLSFVAGTMFITQKDIISKLLDNGFSDNDFEDERGQLDGTLSHAIERFFPVICKSIGRRIIELGEHKTNYDFKYAARG